MAKTTQAKGAPQQEVWSGAGAGGVADAFEMARRLFPQRVRKRAQLILLQPPAASNKTTEQTCQAKPV